MSANKLFLITGSDFTNRKRALEGILSRVGEVKNVALKTQTLFSKDIELESLKNILFSFSFTGERIIVFKAALGLRKPIKDFLYKNLKKILDTNVLVFEIEKDFDSLKRDKSFSSDLFFRSLSKQARMFKISSFHELASIGAFLYALRQNKINESIYLLHTCFKASPYKESVSMQIIGALTREYSRLGDPIKKEKCFDLIWETERSLKTGKSDSELALELLITKLLGVH